MEKKCCNNGCMHMCGCCGCAEEKPSVLYLTVGTVGDFKTLREALECVRTTICNSARITLVSNVVEEGTAGITIDGMGGFPPIIIDGNYHTLDLSKITDPIGIASHNQKLRFRDITIYAPNVSYSVIAPHNASQLYMNGMVTIIGGGVSKKQIGIQLQNGVSLTMTDEGPHYIKECETGVRAGSSSNATIIKEINFTNVKIPYSPEKETVGNRNSFIGVNY